MIKKIFIIFIFTLIYFLWSNVYANINLTVSPIKYEIEAATWSIVTKTATLFNNSDKTFYIKTGKSDFESKNNSWSPRFVRKSELVYPDQVLSEWITVSTWSFIIEPWEKQEIDFTIEVPENATPGWYYWAVFFKNNNSETASETAVSVNVDYWVLILLKVDWEVVYKWEVKETKIKNKPWSWWWGWESSLEEDDCSIDLTSSRFDWKCIDNFFETDKEIINNIEKINNSDEINLEIKQEEIETLFKNEDKLISDIQNINNNEITEKEIEDFSISFETLFENDWNIHLKPSWKVVLKDESWEVLKSIWKEIIRNQDWTEIWTEIVDYLPINDIWWSVLPWTDREFISEWKWFPYKAYDENWDIDIKYWSPWEYYTKKNIQERWFLYPWERINERINKEKITADINLFYTDENWEKVEFNSAKEFFIDYKEEYIWYNPYFIAISSLVWLIFIFFIFRRKKENRCINKKCREIIKKDIEVCPYCWVKQSDKRYKTKKKKK